jgi:hypothetical protein
MQITIKKIVFPPHQEEVKFSDGKPGKKWVGLYEIDEDGAGEIPQATVETFAKDTAFISVGAKLEATKREFKGVVSYAVKNPASAGAGGGAWGNKREWKPAPRLTAKRYDALAAHLFDTSFALVAKIRATLKVTDAEALAATVSVFDKQLGTASVLIDIDNVNGVAKPAEQKPATAPAQPAKITPASEDDLTAFNGDKSKDPRAADPDDSIF